MLPMGPPRGSERLLLNHEKTLGFLASREEFNPEPKTSLISQSFCVIKFYSSIKEIEKASDIDIRKGQKEYHPAGLQ